MEPAKESRPPIDDDEDDTDFDDRILGASESIRLKQKNSWSKLSRVHGLGASDDEAREQDSADKPQTLCAETCLNLSDSQTCVICMEAFTVHGEHQTSCLKCGHLFGYKCIEKWIRLRTVRAKKLLASCPSCNKPARKNDIRRLMTANVKALDNAQLSSTREELKAEKAKRRALELEVANLKLVNTTLTFESSELRRQAYGLKGQVEDLKSRALVQDATENPSALKLLWQANVGGVTEATNGLDVARCLAFDASSNALVVAKSFPDERRGLSYGLKIFDFFDPKMTEAISGVHCRVIRDIKAERGRILSASLDKTLALTGVKGFAGSTGIVWRAKLAAPAWSCCFHPSNEYLVYAGLSNGSLAAYDVRLPQSDNPIYVLVAGDPKSGQLPSTSGIHSLHAITCDKDERHDVLLGANLQKLGCWNLRDRRYHSLTASNSEPSLMCADIFNDGAAFTAQFRAQSVSLLAESGDEHTVYVNGSLSLDNGVPTFVDLREMKVAGKQSRLVKTASAGGYLFHVSDSNKLQLYSSGDFLPMEAKGVSEKADTNSSSISEPLETLSPASAPIWSFVPVPRGIALLSEKTLYLYTLTCPDE